MSSHRQDIVQPLDLLSRPFGPSASWLGSRARRALRLGVVALSCGLGCGGPTAPRVPTLVIDQAAINRGELTPDELFAIGERIFDHRFSCAEGAGLRRDGACVFDRVHGPESQTCLECHNSPVDDGGGTLASNVLRLFDPQSGRFVVRNPPHLFGVGYIERLAAEMTAELSAQRQQAIELARKNGQRVTVTLQAKGLDFGILSAEPSGESHYQGTAVQPDLVVRPFMAKGLDPTLRQQNLGALLSHFAIQPSELVGADHDADQDGVTAELSPGQVSALVGYQALLPVPSFVAQDALAASGAQRFIDVGCADCHTPLLPLSDPRYFLADPAAPTSGMLLDLPLHGRRPVALRLGSPGPVQLPLFSDLRRHDLGPELADPRDTPLARAASDYLLADGSPEKAQLELVPRNLFMTPRLWGVGSTAPYLHDGRAPDLEQAILAHGGEAATAREKYLQLAGYERLSILSYLRSLVLLREDTTMNHRTQS